MTGTMTRVSGELYNLCELYTVAVYLLNTTTLSRAKCVIRSSRLVFFNMPFGLPHSSILKRSKIRNFTISLHQVMRRLFGPISKPTEVK